MFISNIAIMQKAVERCLFFKFVVVITVNIIINYLWEHLEFFAVLVLFCYGYYGGLKNLIWHVSERRKETGVACDVFVI